MNHLLSMEEVMFNKSWLSSTSNMVNLRPFNSAFSGILSLLSISETISDEVFNSPMGKEMVKQEPPHSLSVNSNLPFSPSAKVLEKASPIPVPGI